MAIYFSATPISFYDSAFGSVPEGAVEISAERHAELMEAQSQGFKFSLDTAGGLFLIPPNPPQVFNPVPLTVTNFQARAVLMNTPGPNGASMFDYINTTLNANKDTQEGAAAWQAFEYANIFSRDGVTINRLGTAFGLSQDQLDQIFIAASKITA